MKAKLTILGLILVTGLTLGLFRSFKQQSALACEDGCDHKIYWCHCEPNGNCQTLHLDRHAIINAGHMDASGNPLHAGDYSGQCVDPSPSPSPRVSPEPSPDPSPDPSPSPESSPEPEQQVNFSASGPKCTNNFSTKLEVKVGGVGQSGIKVKFSYKSETKEAVTNSDGIAGVDFEFKGNGEITASADGYPNQTVGVEQDTDCPSGTGGETGNVLGATTEGQVLGAMAGTGSAVTDLFSFVFALGSGLVGLGTKVYAQNQKKN